MAPEDRRAMIAEKSVPLFLEYGQALTTRQLAEQLGIAEGTIFRAFGDKESLIRAAVEAFLTQGRARMAEGLVDPSLPLEEKVAALVTGMRTWTRSLMQMLALVDRDAIPSIFSRHSDDTYQAAVAAAFAPDAAELRVDVERMGAILRMAGMAANAAHFDQHADFTDDELVHIILYGIAGVPRGSDT